jgi:hypothetical protein
MSPPHEKEQKQVGEGLSWKENAENEVEMGHGGKAVKCLLSQVRNEY